MNPQAKQARNQINPEKLLLSKWTAVTPQNKEKHFLITEIIRDDQNAIISCILEAVLTRQSYKIDWLLLKNQNEWIAGWH